MIGAFKQRYFEGNLAQGFFALYTGKTISNVAINLFGMFLPIFLYRLFDGNFTFVALYFLAGYLINGLSIPLGAFFLNRYGFNHSLRLSTFFAASTFVILYFITPSNMLYLLPLQIAATTIYRLLFWLPYHVDFATFSDATKRGSEIGMFEATLNVIGVVTPVLAGFIITQYGFGILFIIATIIFLLSLIPYHFIPEINERFTWTYWHTIKQLVVKKNRRSTFAFMADGAEEVVGFIVWPIVIYQLLQGDILKVGVISTLIVAATVLAELVVGKYSDDKKMEKQLLKYGSILAAIGWILKIFIVTALQIFVVDAYHKLTKIMMKIPFVAMTYERVADRGHYIDEYTVLYEMAINMGRVIMIAVIIAMAFVMPLQWTFIFGAIASIFLNVLRVRHHPQALRPVVTA
ncbi:MAG: hypothetical protein ACD_81C00126G0003 [uncultured bacterium]|uniref:Major facilitator superfamily n=2 Tax=Candidatus Wolfeibacteriota TaxID=1752735 RepID=A0A0G1HBA6_9BACT|nr:MAG: hypothetical protein ACD_81C00126G0003 [uncultured bacterium]KKR12882.1 MAG: Major facilitator superfamily [Candidatus Wolfebacteria bacterium GW2011_GWC2_39_22]KKT43813.1 MAG: Major facilitator superfamily [Candidatus Wolfebacteria bacterium GW2011_GWE2_44_13]HBI25458.1 hypothetical protein [Candidatus Wolfebacteria bacterium]